MARVSHNLQGTIFLGGSNPQLEVEGLTELTRRWALIEKLTNWEPQIKRKESRHCHVNTLKILKS